MMTISAGRQGVMSREIAVTEITGHTTVYRLAIATFIETQTGYLENLQTVKYEKEIAGIEYFDCRIEFVEIENGKWKMIVG